MDLKLLSRTPDAKTKKSLQYEYTTFILYLDPRIKGICQYASIGCKASCLFTAGRGIMRPVMEARRRKTSYYLSNPEGFKKQLQDELNQIKAWSRRTGKKFCVRLNGTSDLDFSDVIKNNGDVIFYDYTKDFKKWRNNTLENYHLTFSRSETNESEVNEVLQRGGNVAIVFQDTLPKTFKGFSVINGDVHDLRFLDPKNVVVGLRAKGKAKSDIKGFAIKNRELPMVEV